MGLLTSWVPTVHHNGSKTWRAAPAHLLSKPEKTKKEAHQIMGEKPLEHCEHQSEGRKAAFHSQCQQGGAGCWLTPQCREADFVPTAVQQGTAWLGAHSFFLG